MKRVLLSAGHDNTFYGAASHHYYLTEHHTALSICDMVCRLMHGKVMFLDCDQFTCDFTNINTSLKYKINTVNNMHRDSPIDLCLELHFNASEDHTAHGSEVLYHADSPAGKYYASIFQPLLEHFDGKVDGRPNKHTTTKAFISHTVPPSIILEPLFIDNPTDSAILLTQSGRMKLAIAIADGINLSMKDSDVKEH